MEWTVVGVIVVLIGLFFTVGKPVMNLVSKLDRNIYDTERQEKEINRDIESIKELTKIAQAHENRLANIEDNYGEVRAQTSELLKVTLSHEARITTLESKSKDNK